MDLIFLKIKNKSVCSFIVLKEDFCKSDFYLN